MPRRSISSRGPLPRPPQYAQRTRTGLVPAMPVLPVPAMPRLPNTCATRSCQSAPGARQTVGATPVRPVRALAHAGRNARLAAAGSERAGPHPGVPRAGDGLGPVSHVQLAEDVRDVVPDGLVAHDE